MSRIQTRFEEIRKANRKALVTFVTGGDPDLESTRRIFAVIEQSGADIVELGVPFSDPLADGPVIQASSQRSLKSGTSLKKVIQLVADIRKDSQLPIVLMTSFNPVFVYGQQQFVVDTLQAGVDGVIIPDLPPEESGPLEAYASQKGLDMIYLLAPTSTEKRIQIINERSRGFIYYISLTGTTGVRTSLAGGIGKKVAAIKQTAKLPVLVGFGISGPEQAKNAAEISDGVIVGSAIVKLIEQNSNPEERDKKVSEFVAGIKESINGLS